MSIYTLKSGMGGITVTGSSATTTGVDVEDLLLYTQFLSGEGVQTSTALDVTENSPAGKSVLVAPGICYVLNDSWAEGSNAPKFWPIIVTANEVVTISDNVSGNPRIDVIYAKYDTAASADDNASNVASIEVEEGTPAASPSVPATPSNGTKLAEVAVANGFTSITNANITDSRIITGLSDESGGWKAADETWTYASATTFTISGDKTAKYFIGMRVKLTQTSVKYFLITAVSFGGGNTTVTLYGGATTLANAAITDPYYSHSYTPTGFSQTLNVGAYSKILARAYLNSAQNNLVSGTPTKVALDAESYDPGSYFNTTTNRFVCPYDGYYLVTCQVAFTSASTVADRAYNVDIYKNNASYKSNSIHAAAALGIRPSVTDIVEANATDYIEMFATSVAGVDTVDLVTGATFTNMTVALLALK